MTSIDVAGFPVLLYWYVYIFLSLSLASFCAIDRHDRLLNELYAGVNVTLLSFFLFLFSGSYHFGAVGGIVFLLFCCFPVPHRTVGWIFKVTIMLLLRPIIKDRSRRGEADLRYRRACRICGWALLILYAGVFACSVFVFPDVSFLHDIKILHYLIVCALLVLLAYLRNPVLLFIGKRW